MSKVELYEAIRKANREEGLGVRALASRFHVHRRNVREALASATPPQRKVPERLSPALGPYRETIREWLTADLSAPRHTAHRVWVRLRDEHGAAVSESTVRTFVAEVRFELANHARLVTVPQTHGPGEQAEVDFGEFAAWIDGVVTKLWMFCMRLSHSGRGFHLAFANQATEAFLEGHVEAFAHFGGVPAGHIRYDNLKPAVIKVLLGRARLENERFVALRSHYFFDSFYCEPGLDGAHEKGGVEGEIGRFRRNHLVPVPKVASLAELNAFMAATDAADDDRHIARRPETVGQAAAAEASHLRPLPPGDFDVTTTLHPIVDTKARIPRRAFEMLNSAPGVVTIANAGTQAIAFSRLSTGDLVFFDAATDDGTQIDHVGMYLGVDSGGHHRFVSSRKTANGPTLGDLGGKSLLDGTGHYAVSFRAARRL